MKNLILSTCLLFTLHFLGAQPQIQMGTGLDLEDPAYEQMDELQADGSKAVLPPEVSLYHYTPFPRNQGRAQSCVGWAAGYSALTIEKAIQYNLRSRERITQYAFSALYVYNQIREGDCMRNGSRITDALAFLEQKGNVMAGQFDENVEDCGRQSTPELEQEASRFRITDYLKLFPLEEAPRQKVFKVKYALSKQKPVVIGMKIRKNFFHIQNNAQFWWPEIGDRTPAGGHAMTVVGYDDRRGAFLLMNSWGRKWGLGGYIWVKYEVFANFCKYAFILQVEDSLDDFWEAAYEEPETNASREPQINENNPPRPNQIRRPPVREPQINENNPPRPNQIKRPQAPPHRRPANVNRPKPIRKMAGNFDFRYNPNLNQHTSFFESADVVSRGFYYQLKKKDWQVGQQFQLEVNNLEKNAYVYVVSVNNDGQVYIHWPRKEALNPRFRSQNASALILEDQSQIMIPSPNRALKIVSPGRDHLVILFSKKPLRGLANLLEQIEGSRDNLPQRLIDVLGQYMVPLADIDYEPNEVAFQVNTRSEGMIVPLIIEVQSQ